MAATSSFWTPASSRDFHTSVAKLRQLTEIPSNPQYYRSRPVPVPEGHVLSFEDELQIADNMAYLAHRSEGAVMVSAVTLQERSSGLVVVLASNSTPSPPVIHGFKKILNIVSRYSGERKRRHECCQDMFHAVLQLSQQRILGRIQPPWMPNPSYIKTQRPFLRDQIRCWGKKFLERHGSVPQARAISAKASELAQCLDQLNAEMEANEISNVL
ncbi:hypothetical protein B0T11DRAFT_353892, partial [Plectosphaerella cucumerina]